MRPGKSKTQKELEKIMKQKPGALQGTYRRQDVVESWGQFSDSVQRSIFYVTDEGSNLITQINAVNLAISLKEIRRSEAKEELFPLLNIFEILWNISSASTTAEGLTGEDQELLAVAKRVPAGTHLLRIKEEYIKSVFPLITSVLPEAFEGEKVVLKPENYGCLFSERLIKTWEDLQIALALLIENILLRAHVNRLSHIYRMEDVFKEFEEELKISPPVEKNKKEKKQRKKRKKRKGPSKSKTPYNCSEMLKIVHIQRWWRKTIVKRSYSEPMRDLPKKDSLLFELSEDELIEDTERSSSSGESDHGMQDHAMFLLRGHFLQDEEASLPQQNFVRKHSTTSAELDEIDKLLQSEYALTDQRLAQDAFAQQTSYTAPVDWSFYPIVNHYYPYYGLYYQPPFLNPTQIIKPYHN